MFTIFKELLTQGRVEKRSLCALRVKLHTPCQWSCSFCHMEGNPSSQSIRNDIRFTETLTAFRDRLGLTEVHFTGGEPSIHPEIISFIEKTKALGLAVKMTTNGQARPTRYLEYIQAGLDEINMSVHTLDPGELGVIMSPPKNAEWGRRALERQIDLIDVLHGKVRIKINTCIGEAPAPAFALAELVRQKGISWRLMNILEIPEISYATLKKVCEKLGAIPACATVINGSSSCSISMRCEDGLTLKLKLIQPHFLPHMCSGCELQRHGGCYEFAYGPRLEMEKGMLMVRNCIHRDGPPFSLPVHAYFSHPVYTDLKKVIKPKTKGEKI